MTKPKTSAKKQPAKPQPAKPQPAKFAAKKAMRAAGARAINAAGSPLESLLGYAFRDGSLLKLALTHSSYTHENLHLHASAEGTSASVDSSAESSLRTGFDNERLEFVGDAVLGLIVSEALYHAFPVSDEGVLTRLRSTLVSRPSLAALGETLALAPQLQLGASAVRTDAARRPAVLADATEALLAALYLDGGYDVARVFVQRFLLAPQQAALQKAVAEAEPGRALRDAKSVLQERVQASGLGRLQYADLAQSGPAHALQFVVQAQIVTADKVIHLREAEGSSKKQAQQLAAQRSLDAWPEGAALESAAPESAALESAAPKPATLKRAALKPATLKRAALEPAAPKISGGAEV
jgi:ribonuclease-3